MFAILGAVLYMFLNTSFDFVHRWNAQLAELKALAGLHLLSTTNPISAFFQALFCKVSALVIKFTLHKIYLDHC